jgi:hypothetical protein
MLWVYCFEKKMMITPIEPVFYLSILQLVAINAVRDVTMRCSSEIPSYHPLEVLKRIEHLLVEKQIIESSK